MTQRSNLPAGQILSRRVALRRVHRVSDIGAARWVGWLNDPAVREHLESVGVWDTDRLVAWLKQNDQGHRTRVYAIRVDGAPVGTLKLDGMKPLQWASVGLMIGEPLIWGLGVGTEAIIRACRIVRRARGWGLWAGIRAANVGSWRAFDKAGFSQVARIDHRRHYWAVPGIVPEECEPMMAATKAWPPDPPRVVVMKRLHQ